MWQLRARTSFAIHMLKSSISREELMCSLMRRMLVRQTGGHRIRTLHKFVVFSVLFRQKIIIIEFSNWMARIMNADFMSAVRSIDSSSNRSSWVSGGVDNVKNEILENMQKKNHYFIILISISNIYFPIHSSGIIARVANSLVLFLHWCVTGPMMMCSILLREENCTLDAIDSVGGAEFVHAQ